MKIIFKITISCLLFISTSFVDIACGEEFRRSNQLLGYAASLINLDPRRIDETEEYNSVKQLILANLTKERNNPSLRTSTKYHTTDDGQDIATTTTLPMPLADYVNVVVHKPTTHNPEFESDCDACPYATREQWSLLHVAAANNDSELISMLVDHEAHINLQFTTTIFGPYTGRRTDYSRERTYYTKDELDNTPLHIALHNNCPQAAITLLNLGAKFNILNATEKTAYDLTTKGDEIRTLMQQKDLWAGINNQKVHVYKSAQKATTFTEIAAMRTCAHFFYGAAWYDMDPYEFSKKQLPDFYKMLARTSNR